MKTLELSIMLLVDMEQWLWNFLHVYTTGYWWIQKFKQLINVVKSFKGCFKI